MREAKMARNLVCLVAIMTILYAGPAQAEPQLPETGSPAVETAAIALPAATSERTAARQTLIVSITIFVLAIFLGVELIKRVPQTLHTPLMSGSNAVSGITAVGAVIAAGSATGFASLLGCLAIVLAMTNVVGGFLVTHRMLRMFKRK
jgi:NAD(P) transhydrogenase subunit alpha